MRLFAFDELLHVRGDVLFVGKAVLAVLVFLVVELLHQLAVAAVDLDDGNRSDANALVQILIGFVAQQIDKLTISGRAIELTIGPSNDDVAILSTDDVRLLEVG